MLWCLEPGTLSMSISLVFIPSSGFSCVQIFASLWTLACQAPLSMEFSRQEYWNGLPCPPPGDLPDPGIELTSLCLLHWQANSLPLAPPGKLTHHYTFVQTQWTHNTKSEPQHKLWIMMRQDMFICGKKKKKKSTICWVMLTMGKVIHEAEKVYIGSLRTFLSILL